ncbi:MAG: hypothetical protein MJ094_01055 [Saccharofermentans sp.]|nr:hypothetical protein [Saccharofermentans sp.]
MKNLTKKITTGIITSAIIASTLCMTTMAAEVEDTSSVHYNSIDEVIASWEEHANNFDFENSSFNFTVEMNEYDDLKQFQDYVNNKRDEMAANNCYSLADYYLYSTDTNVSSSCSLNENGETYTGSCDFSFKTNVHGTVSDFIAARNEAAQIASQWAECDDLNKVVAIIDWLCNNTTYDYDGASQGIDNGHSLSNCIFDHFCVCDANAQAFQAMAEAIGLRSVILNGEVRGEGHAWNAVCIDGSWYFVDPTVANQPNCIDYRRVLFGTESTEVAANEYEYVTSLPISTSDYSFEIVG